MKKNIIIAAIAAASALLLSVSCEKESLHESQNGINGGAKTFTATIEQGLTKTTITSEYKVNWVEEDQIDINGSIFSATPDASDATKASLTKVSGSDPTPDYTAVYPASIMVGTQATLPATQTYAAGKFNVPMCAMSSTETLEFKNFCGVLCFALKGTDKVKSIAVTANEQLCGPFEFADATSFSFTEENKGYTVTLDCGEGVQLSSTDSTNFYVYLPPKDSYTAGMKIVVTSTEGKTFEKTTTTAVKIERNNLYTFDWAASFSGSAEPEYVEIGGVKWATKNLGAKKVTDSGDYFAWGETAPYYEGTGGWPATPTWKSEKKFGYVWQSYCGSSSFSEWSTPPYDATTKILKPDYDVAAQILGNGWRMPTSAEFQALYDACGGKDNTPKSGGSTSTTEKGVYWCDNYDGVKGLLFCDGTNKLFFPAVGDGNGTALFDAGSSGFYWSSSLYTSDTDAYYMWFVSGLVRPQNHSYRSGGFSVRPVKDPSAAPKCDVEVKFYYVSELLPDKTSQFPDCSSLAYTISSQSKDVTSVKVAMAKKSAIDRLLESGYTRERIASEYYSPELSECLSELSTNGAFSDIFSSLDFSTEYEIIVLASNSYGESALVYDIKTTAPYTGELVIGDYTITDEVSLGAQTSKQTFTVISKDGTDSNLSIKNLAYNDNFEWYATYNKDAHTLTLDGSAYRYETHGSIFLYTLYNISGYSAGYWAGNTGSDPIVFSVDPTTHQISGLQTTYALFASSGSSITGYFKYFAAGKATIVKGD